MLSMLMPTRETSSPSMWTQSGMPWYSLLPKKTLAGPVVSEDRAMTYSAVYAATRGIAGTLGRIPFELFRRKTRGWEVLDDDPRANLFDGFVNPWMKSVVFRTLMTTYQINYGNGVAEIQRDRMGNPTAMHVIHPSRLYPKQDPDTGEYYIGVRNDRAADTDLMPEDVFHITNWETDCTGFWGIGVINRASESIGTALGAEKNRANQFSANNVPAVVVETPKLMAPDDRVAFRKEWREVHSEGGAPVALLTNGATAKALNLNYRDMQHLELSYFSIEDVSRWYGIPVHMMAHLLKSSQNNIEHLSTEFVQFCLLIYGEHWEQEADNKLIMPDERGQLDWEFQLRALTRGDNQARTARYQSAITLGWMTRNEVREEEGYNPLEGGDEPLVQGAMKTADQAAAPVNPQQTPAASDETQDKWIESTAKRVAKIEATAMRRMAENPATFPVKTDEYWARHESIVAEAFADVIGDKSAAVATHWVTCSRDAVGRISDTETVRTLAGAVDRWCEKLVSERPGAAVEFVKGLK